MIVSRRTFLDTVKFMGTAYPLAFAGNAEASLNDRELMVLPIFDGRYNALSGAEISNDRKVASQFFPLSLDQLVKQQVVVPADETRDFGIILGILHPTNGSVDGTVNLVRGMGYMWTDKIDTLERNKHQYKSAAVPTREELEKKKEVFMRKVAKGTKYSLLDLRANEITGSVNSTLRQLDSVGQWHYGQRLGNQDMARFITLAMQNLTPNVLVGYVIHEVIPTVYEGKQINPVFKSYFLDRLLMEGGKEFIEGFPARYDPFRSFGPFQITDIPLAEILRREDYNDYVNGDGLVLGRFKVDGTKGRNNSIPKRINDFRGLQDHVNAALMIAYHNWETLGKTLQGAGQLRKFNTMLSGLGSRESQIVVAGLTAGMHHAPNNTNYIVRSYLETSSRSANMFSEIKEPSFWNHVISGVSPQMRRKYTREFMQFAKYYNSAVQAYLVMKVFDVLKADYRKKI